MKKFTNICLTILLGLYIFIGNVHSVQAEEVYSSGYLYYTIENKSVSIIGNIAKEEEVEIPSSIAGYPVNTIKKDAFPDSTYVKKVILPDCVTTVEKGAFASDIEVVYTDTKNPGNIFNENTVTEDKESTEMEEEEFLLTNEEDESDDEEIDVEFDEIPVEKESVKEDEKSNPIWFYLVPLLACVIGFVLWKKKK